MKDAKAIIEDVILNGSPEEKRELYQFDSTTPHKIIAKKFKLFARGNFPRYFKSKSAPVHDDWIKDMINWYYGFNILNIASRGLAKTTLKKLFDCFVLLNDLSSHRKYMKVLTKDGKNSRQIVTDVYNLMVEVRDIYGDVFEKEGDLKREETMSGFTMKNGRKYSSGTVGQTQRGHIQDAYRPDALWGDDLEDRESIRSLVITQGIVDKWEEAVDGLAKDGSYYVTANYISDQGVIEHIKGKDSVKTRITPIMDEEGNPTWDYYSKEDIEQIRKDADDFYGEFLCDPQRSENKFFDIARIEEDMKKALNPIRESAGVKYWKNYLSHHRYGMGSDHSEGIGLDSNTLALFDFTTGELVVAYANNKITPDLAAYEFVRVGEEFGNCIYAPEVNNKCGGTALAAIRSRNYPNIYRQETTNKLQDKKTDNLGWTTKSNTKYNMFFEFRKDYNDGLIKIYDIEALKEMKAYSNADLQESNTGLITRHFDLLTAMVIAWQMRKHATQAQSSLKTYSKAYDSYLNALA